VSSSLTEKANTEGGEHGAQAVPKTAPRSAVMVRSLHPPPTRKANRTGVRHRLESDRAAQPLRIETATFLQMGTVKSGD
jgi:hypothetical protein